MHPPEFEGTADPNKAQVWIKEIEKVFRVVQVAEAQKTIFATFMLKGEANFWWESVERMEGNQVIAWTRFKELFFEYFPRCLKTKKEMKFLELKQEDMTVAEYEAKFTELSRFARHHVRTERREARRFEQGLKPWIYNKLSVLQINNYAELVQKASIAESSDELLQKYKEEKRRKGNNENDNRGRKRKIGVPFIKGSNEINQINYDQSKGMYEQCKTCGKHHGGNVCLKSSGRCFNCGQQCHMSPDCPNRKGPNCYQCGMHGHISRDCPQGKKDPTGTKINKSLFDNKPTARVFNMAFKHGSDEDVAMGNF